MMMMMMMRHRRIVVALIAWAAESLVLLPSVNAADLLVKWIARDGNIEAQRTLGLSDLDALEQQEILTTTAWNSEPRKFTGPALRELSEITGLSPLKAELQALNDYSVEVPREDWLDYDVLLSTRIDGKLPRIYEKGPYWLIYNVDKMPKPTSQKILSRMIWQVDRITFYVD